MSVIGCITWCKEVVVNASPSHNTLIVQEQTHRIAVDFSINSCGRFYKIYCSNIECLIIREVYLSESESERIRIRNILFDHNTCTVYYESYSFIKYRGQG